MSGVFVRGLAALAGSLCLAATPLSAQDNPEPGLQGQTTPEQAAQGVLPVPYSKGVRLVGHSNVWNRGGNIVLAWVDSCAYISSGGAQGLESFLPGAVAKDPAREGVAVIDVSNPREPKAVRLLRDRGSIHAAETIHAISARGRKVLVAGDYGGGKQPGRPAWLSIYDASDCKNPQLMAEYQWPENTHMVTLSPDGRRVYGTVIDPFAGKGGIQVLDISDLVRPRFVGKFAATKPDGKSFEFAAHEVSISPDERRIYAGVIASSGGDLNQEFRSGPVSAERLGPEAGGVYIFDNSDLVDGRPNPKLRLIGTAQGGGWHSVQQANIGGVPYLVGAGELGACPGAWPRLSNAADETRPILIGEFRLAVNRKENCPPQTAVEKASGGIVGAPGTAASHFNDVDSATDTRLGLFPFMYAGLRIADLRDPVRPVEIAYFRPGDACMSHVRYTRGHIWFACTQSGFYVIELQKEVRAALVRRPAYADRRDADGKRRAAIP